MLEMSHRDLGLNRALALGLVIFGVLAYVAAVFVRQFPPIVWTGLALIAIMASVIIVRQKTRNNTPSQNPTNSTDSISDETLWHDRVWWLPYLLPLPAFLLVASSNRLLISNHGAYHSLYIFHLLNGPLPPENVLIPGLPSNIYWMYHALLAAITVGLNIAAPVASFVLNVMTLMSSYFWGASLVASLRPALRRTFRGSLIVMLMIFGGNLAGGLHAAYRHMAGSAAGQTLGVGIQFLLIDGDTRSSHLLPKLLNFNGFPLGVMFFLMAMTIGVRAVDRGLRLQDVVWLSIALLGATHYHFVTATLIVAVLPLTLTVTWLLQARWGDLPYRRLLDALWSDVRSTRGIWLWGISGIIAVVLTGQYVWRIMSATPPGTIGVTLGSYPHLWLVFGHTYPLIIPFAFAARDALRQRDRQLIFLSLTAITGLILAWLLELPDGNEYKYVMLSTMAMSATVFVWLVDWSPGAGWGRVMRGISIAAVGILLAANMGYAAAASAARFATDDNVYSFEGRHVIAQGDPYEGAFAWINANTPADSVVMLPIEQRDYPAFSMLERLPYVTDAYVYGEGIPEYHERFATVSLIYDEGSTQEEVEAARVAVENEDLSRPLYMIIPADPSAALASLDLTPLYGDSMMTVVRLR